MFFKIIRLIVIAGLAWTCNLDAAAPAAESGLGIVAELQKDSAEKTEPAPKSDFDRFIDAWDFNADYKTSQAHAILAANNAKVTPEWCIRNASSGSPLVIKMFIEKSVDLHSDSNPINVALLNFLAKIAEHGRLISLNSNSIINFNSPGLFSKELFTHELIYKIGFYTGDYGKICNCIFTNRLQLNNSLKKIAALLRLMGTPAAKYSYAVMLHNKQIHRSFDGKTTYTISQSTERYTEVARLYREANTPDAEFHYAFMLLNKQIHRSFDGKTTYTISQSTERYTEVARLYRRINTPNAKLFFLYLILSNVYKKTLSGEQLETDKSAYQYVINTINDSFLIHTLPIKKILALPIKKTLALAYEKLGDLDKVFALRDEEEALGFTTDTDEQTDSKSSSDQEENHEAELTTTQTKTQIENLSRENTRKRRAVSTAAQKAQSASNSIIIFDVSDESLKREYKDRGEAWKAQWKSETPENRAKRYAKIQAELMSGVHAKEARNFNDYTHVFANGAAITQVPEDSSVEKFNSLIQGIKEKNSDGAPHMLKGNYHGFKLIARSLTKKHRIVYYFDHEQKQIVVVQCGGHYADT